jgi:hypothetical protein
VGVDELPDGVAGGDYGGGEDEDAVGEGADFGGGGGGGDEAGAGAFGYGGGDGFYCWRLLVALSGSLPRRLGFRFPRREIGCSGRRLG